MPTFSAISEYIGNESSGTCCMLRGTWWGITRSAETHRQRAARYRMEALCKGIRLDAAGVAAFRRAVADDVGGLAAAIWPWLGPVPGTRS